MDLDLQAQSIRQRRCPQRRTVTGRQMFARETQKKSSSHQQQGVGKSRTTCHVSAITGQRDRTQLSEQEDWHKESCDDLMDDPIHRQRSTTGLGPSLARQNRYPAATAPQLSDGLDSALHCHLHNATWVGCVDVHMGSVPMHHL